MNDRVQNVLVLISNAAHPALNDGAVRNAVAVLQAQGATVGTPTWLAPEIACDIPFDGDARPVAMTSMTAVAGPAGEDRHQPRARHERRSRLRRRLERAGRTAEGPRRG